MAGSGKFYFYPDIISNKVFALFLHIYVERSLLLYGLSPENNNFSSAWVSRVLIVFISILRAMLNGDNFLPIFDAWIYGVAYKRATFEWIPLFVIVKFAVSRRQQQQQSNCVEKTVDSADKSRSVFGLLPVYCVKSQIAICRSCVWVSVYTEHCAQPICKKG